MDINAPVRCASDGVNGTQPTTACPPMGTSKCEPPGGTMPDGITHAKSPDGISKSKHRWCAARWETNGELALGKGRLRWSSNAKPPMACLPMVTAQMRNHCGTHRRPEEYRVFRLMGYSKSKTGAPLDGISEMQPTPAVRALPMISRIHRWYAPSDRHLMRTTCMRPDVIT
ncbi:hypothetical protein AVEN_60794-1 [Araneus ventricosus]|uniref:Uncharacterized protein n=1 Tax=Araneus ventricosus TaxID=182803 RepID=A0A4Y2VJ77_ARAVE|nr:hypothetical protein AVEN_60794-1 [Araneus ventricosus]